MSDTPENEQWVPDPRFELHELRRPTFTMLHKGGLDPTQVEAYVLQLEKLAKSFVGFTRELEARIARAHAETRDAQRTERKSVDDAMLSAFEAKERILMEAEERAWEIEEEARKRAAATLSAPSDGSIEEIVTLRSQVTAYQAEIEDLRLQVTRWRQRLEYLEAMVEEKAVAEAERLQQIAADASARIDDAAARAERAVAEVERARAEAATLAGHVKQARAETLRLRQERALLTGRIVEPLPDATQAPGSHPTDPPAQRR